MKDFSNHVPVLFYDKNQLKYLNFSGNSSLKFRDEFQLFIINFYQVEKSKVKQLHGNSGTQNVLFLHVQT